MKLRYLLCQLDYSFGNTHYRGEFANHTNYIDNYLSKAIRKYKYETDGTYNGILVLVGPNKVDSRIINNIINICVPFDKERYEQIKGTDNCSYYLELFRTAFDKGYPGKDIPKDILNAIVDEFEQNGCNNSWLFKRKRIKEHDLKAEFVFKFTTNDISLNATFSKISTKEVYCSGNILRTKPNKFYIEDLKDIVVEDNEIQILGFRYKECIILKIEDIKRGFLDVDGFWL